MTGRGEAHEVIAEAGIASLADAGEPVGEQAADAVRLVHGRAGADRKAMDLAVGAKEREFDEARALAPRLHRIAEPDAQARDRPQHVAFARDRLGEMLLGHIGGRGPLRRDRLVFAAERLIETAQEARIETGGERRARQIEHVGDAVEPDIGERSDGLRVKAQRGERQRRERLPHRAGRHDDNMPVLVIPGRGRAPASPESMLTVFGSAVLETAAPLLPPPLRGRDGVTPPRKRGGDPREGSRLCRITPPSRIATRSDLPLKGGGGAGH